MCLKFFSFTFWVISICFTVQMIALMLGVTKKMRPMESSNFLSSVAVMMLCYIINAVLLMIFVHNFQAKLLMLGFGILPFLIGNVVTYKKLKIYSIIQTLCVIMSGVYVMTF